MVFRSRKILHFWFIILCNFSLFPVDFQLMALLRSKDLQIYNWFIIIIVIRIWSSRNLAPNVKNCQRIFSCLPAGMTYVSTVLPKGLLLRWRKKNQQMYSNHNKVHRMLNLLWKNCIRCRKHSIVVKTDSDYSRKCWEILCWDQTTLWQSIKSSPKGKPAAIIIEDQIKGIRETANTRLLL